MLFSNKHSASRNKFFLLLFCSVYVRRIAPSSHSVSAFFKNHRTHNQFTQSVHYKSKRQVSDRDYRTLKQLFFDISASQLFITCSDEFQIVFCTCILVVGRERNIDMEVGRRVLVPETFGFDPDIVEMRKIGPHPSALPYAVILGFLEQAPYIAPNSFKIAMNTLELDRFFDYRGGRLTNVVIESQQFAPNFEQRCNKFLEYHRISRETDAWFENITMLMEKLRISVSLILGQFTHSIDQKSSHFTIYIGVHQRYCFLLYQKLSRESFVILPCGHLQLRYRLMKSLQQAAGNRAISSSDIIAPICCSDCRDSHYTPEIFSFAESLARGEYVLALPRKPQPESLVCVLCRRAIAVEDLDCCCECSVTVCMQCMAISRLITTVWECPACSAHLQPNAHFDYRISKWENLGSYLPSNLIKSQPNYDLEQKKVCACCHKPDEIKEYLTISEHVNCWICAGCIIQLIRTGGYRCIICDREYDEGLLALLKKTKTHKDKSHQVASSKEQVSIGSKRSITALTREIIEKTHIICSRCACTVILSTLHQCRDGKAHCSDCCFEDIIMTCTDDDIRCRLCRQPYANLDADVGWKKYACSRCGQLKLLKEISHLCQNETYFCWECVQVDMKTHRIFCNRCNFNGIDKWFLRRRGQNPRKK